MESHPRSTLQSDPKGARRPRQGRRDMSGTQISLRGVFTPIVTSFDENGAVAHDKMADNLDRWNRTGLKGYVVLGSQRRMGVSRRARATRRPQHGPPGHRQGQVADRRRRRGVDAAHRPPDGGRGHRRSRRGHHRQPQLLQEPDDALGPFRVLPDRGRPVADPRHHLQSAARHRHRPAGRASGRALAAPQHHRRQGHRG